MLARGSRDVVLKRISEKKKQKRRSKGEEGEDRHRQLTRQGWGQRSDSRGLAIRDRSRLKGSGARQGATKDEKKTAWNARDQVWITKSAWVGGGRNSAGGHSLLFRRNVI